MDRFFSHTALTRGSCALLLAARLIAPVAGWAAWIPPAVPEGTPPPLRAWVGWVLHGQEERACPPLHDDGAVRVCAWPSTLALDLHGRGGTFAQVWDLSSAAWVALPGGEGRWPEEVVVDGAVAVVTAAADGSPRIRLPAGRHQVRGFFHWPGLPEALAVPPASGVITLSLEGVAVALPAFDPQGRLWLQRTAAGDAAADRIEADVARLVRDTIPLQIITRLRLRVSGQVRELLLPGVLPADAIPVSLSSDLPARLEPDGSLRVQVRPGEWTVEVGSRRRGPTGVIAAAFPPEPWPQREVWAFEAQNHLRVVETGGTVAPVDPQQTALPEEWKRFPAFLVAPGQELNLKEVRRGDPAPPPDRLILDRTVWLAMGGASLTFRDGIVGDKNTNWRLEINSPLEVGRVSVDGAEHFITRREGSSRAGVELRQGKVQLVAESTMNRSGSRIPAVGWEQDFSEVRGRLNLPPGWTLFALAGADRVSNSWVSRWTLLDLFLVLIFSLAAGRLWGAGTGALAAVALILSWQQPGAPRWLWAPLLASVALARVVSSERARKAFTLSGRLFLLGLVLAFLPFAYREARVGLFPQLARSGVAMSDVSGAGESGGAFRDAEGAVQNAPIEEQTLEPMSPSVGRRRERQAVSQLASVSGVRGKGDYFLQKNMVLNLPNAAIQTGKGLPAWQWETVHYSWNGPVQRNERLTLWLIGPRTNLVLAWTRILLLAALFLAVAGRDLIRKVRRSSSILALALVLGIGGALPTAPALAASEIPEPALLDELRARLLAPPACLPHCAEIQSLRLEVTPSRLNLELEIHAAADVAVPLPSSPGQWMPDRITIAGAPARGVVHRGGRLLILAPQGVSCVAMTGPLPRLETVLLPLPLRPRRVATALVGWTVDGIHPDGGIDDQLQLTRAVDAMVPTGGIQGGSLPPLVEVERTLRLGLDWVIETTVRRRGPAGAAIVIAVPLLPGESVTKEGVPVENGRVLVNMGPAVADLAWTSLLSQTPEIRLSAPDGETWFEVWKVDASPIWHVETQGAPVVNHQAGDRWLPEWRPWPGEEVILVVTRPEGVPGQTATIDRSRLRLVPGNRSTEAHLSFSLRSSQGGHHAIALPPQAELLEVKIAGRPQSIRTEGGRLSLPVVPGSQAIEIGWRTPGGMGPVFRPELPGLAIPSVNAVVEVAVPGNRWVYLVGGPTLGPAILWWGVLAVIVLAALLLGRVPGTPLGTGSWILVGVGLSQASSLGALLVVGWILSLRARRELPAAVGARTHNLVQVGLVALSLGACVVLVFAVSQGLLGYPNLQIAGNGSTAANLRWYADHSGERLPAVWALSAPLWIFRLLMLGWSLWLAHSFLDWLRWGWESFALGGIWRRSPPTAPRPRWWRRHNAAAAGTDAPAQQPPPVPGA